MKPTYIILLAILFAYNRYGSSIQIRLPAVNTTSGQLEGLLMVSPTGDILTTFFGVPYAKPPIGSLRFKPPVRFTSSKEFIADKMSKTCIQLSSEYLHKSFPPPDLNAMSEDCLYLNIWAPYPLPRGAAVMLWIHGGAFLSGSGNNFYGDILASERLIVVTCNYRLGFFGFLSQDEAEIPGNVGLLDQAMAMKWIKDNIEQFGGDPDLVTIFGESAGAMSVAFHLIIPSSQGLFKRAVLESGLVSYSDKQLVVQSQKILLQALGCNLDRAKMINCLRNKTVTEVFIEIEKLAPKVHFDPVVDQTYIPNVPNVIMAEGGISKNIDIIFGSNNDDGKLITAYDVFGDECFPTALDEKNFDKLIAYMINQNQAILDVVKFLYTNYTRETNLTWPRAIVDFSTDLIFSCYYASLAEICATNGNRVYFYEFRHRPSGSADPYWVRANHGTEVSFVFGDVIRNPRNYTSGEVQLSKRMVQYWTQFAKYGNPTYRNHNVWPQYTKRNPSCMCLNIVDSVVLGVRPQHCYFYNKLLPKISDPTRKTKGIYF